MTSPCLRMSHFLSVRYILKRLLLPYILLRVVVGARLQDNFFPTMYELCAVFQWRSKLPSIGPLGATFLPTIFIVYKRVLGIHISKILLICTTIHVTQNSFQQSLRLRLMEQELRICPEHLS